MITNKKLSNKSNNYIVGKVGEKLASDYLKKKGYKILELNYINNIGEIDIIAKHKSTYVFVEVKYRENDNFGLPREAVNLYKQRKRRAVSNGYIKRHNLYNKTCRFDVVEILGEEITGLS